MRSDRIFVALCAAVTLAMALTARAQKSAPTPVRSMEVIDEVGRRVTLPAAAGRIVSLAPSLTETIYALELQDRLVGDTDFCDFPQEAQAKPHVGGPMNPNLEQVVSLHPDLVLATREGNRLETVEALTRLGIAVYATDPRSVENVIETTRRLSSVLGAGARGDSLALALRSRLAEVRRRVSSDPVRRVFFVVWTDPLISVGKNTFLADALRWAGAESVVETAQDWPRLSIEELIKQQPDYLVFSNTHFDEVARTVEELRARAGWGSLDAVRDRRIAVVSDAVIRPSPRLVDAIEQLARQLHPEAFPPKNEKPREEKPKFKLDTGNAKFADAYSAGPRGRANFEFRASNFSPCPLPASSPEASRCAP